MKHPSAWEQIEGETPQVIYWKWRVRNLQGIAILGCFAAFMMGGLAMVFASSFWH